MKKHCLITGATDGIGRAAARAIAATPGMVATLVLHGRNPEKLAAVAAECQEAAKIAGQSGQGEQGESAAAQQSLKIELVQADFSSLDSVARLAEDVIRICPQLNVLVNNAGLLVNDFSKTADGFESTLGVNHVAPALLTLKLLPLLQRNQPSRIINVASIAHLFVGMSVSKPDPVTGELKRDGAPITTLPSDEAKMNPPNAESFDWYYAYGFSKLCNVMFSRELHRRMQSTKAGVADSSNDSKYAQVATASLHPGVLDTKLFAGLKQGGTAINPTPVTDGIVTILKLVAAPQQYCIETSGRYFDDKGNVAEHSKVVDNEEDLKRLWDLTVKKWAGKYLSDFEF